MKKLTIIALSLFIIFPLFAERIVLKTGKEVNKKITERTDESITVEVLGMPVTYKLSDISSIDDEVFAPVEKKPPVAKEHEEWLEWSRSVEGYVNKSQAVQNELKKSIMPVQNKIAAIIDNQYKNSTPERLKELGEEAASFAHNAAKEMEDIEPPGEFRLYHERMIQSNLCMAKAFEYMSKGDLDSGEIYITESVRFMAESLKEVIKINRRHNAPKEVIAVLDMVIRAVNSQLK